MLILGIVVVHLELHEEAIRREEHPVQERGSSLFVHRKWWALRTHQITSGRVEGDQTAAIRSALKNEG